MKHFMGMSGTSAVKARNVKERLAPKKGLIVRIYFQDNEGVGNGWRSPLIVLRCSKKGVTMFYPPSLGTLRIKVAEWYLLSPELYTVEKKTLYKRIKGTQVIWDRHSFQYSQANLAEALSLVKAHKGTV